MGGTGIRPLEVPVYEEKEMSLAIWKVSRGHPSVHPKKGMVGKRPLRHPPFSRMRGTGRWGKKRGTHPLITLLKRLGACKTRLKNLKGWKWCTMMSKKRPKRQGACRIVLESCKGPKPCARIGQERAKRWGVGKWTPKSCKDTNPCAQEREAPPMWQSKNTKRLQMRKKEVTHHFKALKFLRRWNHTPKMT